MQLARCEYIERDENVIAIGKTHVALINELVEARDERRLLNLQRQLARLKLLIIDEWGFVPLSHTGGGTAHRRAAGPPHPPRAHPGVNGDTRAVCFPPGLGKN